MEGRLREDVTPSDDGALLLLDVERAGVQGEGWRPLRGGVRLSLNAAVPREVVTAWRRGRCVRMPALLREPGTFRNPGVPDADLQLARRGIQLVGQVKSAALVEVCGAAQGWAEAAGTVRDRTRDAVSRHVGTHAAQSAAIVLAILIGDRAAIDARVEDRLRRAGTFHVIAISGGNIAILTGVLFWLLSGVRAPPRGVAVVSMVALAAYGLCVVRGASVDRALFLALVCLGAGAFDVRAHPLALLATAAGGLVVFDPVVAFDVGFALTFGATAGLILLTPPLTRVWRAATSARGPGSRVADAVALSVSATIAAEAVVLPIGAVAFGRVSLAGIVLNLVAIPMMAVAQIAGIAVATFDRWCEPAAKAFGWAAHAAVWALLESARLVDAVPWLSQSVPPPSGWLIAAYATALVGTAAPVLAPRARSGCALAAVCGAVTIVAGAWPTAPADIARRLPRAWLDDLVVRVTFLDVGQGDAVVVQLPGGRSLLIDTGGLAGALRFDLARRVVSPALHALGVRRLDRLVLTHGDPDHAGAAEGVVEDWRPAEVWEGIPVPRHEALAALQSRAAALARPWRRVRASDELLVGSALVRVWHPGPEDWERQRVRNDDSIVLEVRVGDVSIVLPGDVGAAVEQRLVTQRRPGRVCILKAAHHGSAGSSSAEWLHALRPAAIVYSCGRGNWFGHPAPAVLQRAAEVGADSFRTDEDGAVQVIVTPDRVSIVTMRGRWWSRGVR